MDLSEMRVLAFAPAHNSHGKRDASGAFIPEAYSFVDEAYEGEVVLFDNSKPFAARRREVLKLIRASDAFLGCQLDAVAFFCHGWASGIQAGFGMRSVKRLAGVLSDAASSDFLTVPLYCCSTASDGERALGAGLGAGTGDNSFADKLRDELCKAGVKYTRVMGHTTKGHTTRNPDVRFFDGMGTPEGVDGGYSPVKRGTKSWGPWKKALRDRVVGDLRFRFPFMTAADIHKELLT